MNYLMTETAELIETNALLADTANDMMIRSFTMQRSDRKEIK